MVRHTPPLPAARLLCVVTSITGEHVAKARCMVVDVEQPDVGTVKLLGCPIKMSHTLPHPRGAAPTLGQHTREVCTQLLGLSDSDVDALARDGVI